MGPAFRRKKTFSLGTGFSDTLEKGKTFHFSRRHQIETSSVLKTTAVVAVALGGFFLLFTRLFYLTVVNGAYFHTLSESNRVREERVAAPRGVIYGRNGEVLASNRPIYKKCEKEECHTISREEGIELEARGQPVTVELGREYPEKALAAHAVGYLTEITEEDMGRFNAEIRTKVGSGDKFCQECYGVTETIGAGGIEKAFEKKLRGIPGKRLVEVDAEEKELKEMAHVAPTAGGNVYTSIDLPLQKAAQAAVEKIRNDPKIPSKGAAVIASNPRTGEILVFYSNPSFDPNAFVGQDRKDVPTLSTVFENNENPLFNRAISGLYPPGSTFKIITTTAGLEEGALNETTTVEDTGVITVGPFSFTNWYFTQYGRKEGTVDIVKALARSNDIFFYKVGEWVGIEKLEKWGKIFKTTSHLGIEIDGEVEGLIKRDRAWYLGDTYHAAIGQGDVLATPLHVNSWTQIIANNGAFCRPTLLKKDPPKDGKAYQPESNTCTPIGIKAETVRLIREGMRQACTTGGTAWPLFNFAVNTASGSASTRQFINDSKNFTTLEKGIGITVACKTGTAEFGHPQHHTHAWLTAFAPAQDPEIVVTVLIEEGGEGSSIAGPVVKEILSEWFSKERQ